jgi:DNA-binding GntR family transcriptional regulator
MQRPDSLSDRVYGEIKRDILSGAFGPGTHLREAELARRFSVSKTPVREALGRLVHEGLLDVFPRVGYAVTECSVGDAQSILEFRAIIECAAVELAARYITDTELEQLEAMANLDVRPRQRATYDEFFSQNRRFHLLIARASRNAELARAIAGLFDRVDRLLRYRLDIADEQSSLDEMREEHTALVDALRSRDPATARSTLVEALDRTRVHVLIALLAADQERPTRSPAPRSAKSSRRSPHHPTAA